MRSIFSTVAIVALGTFSLLSVAGCTTPSEDGVSADSSESNLIIGPDTFANVANPAFPISGYYEMTSDTCFAMDGVELVGSTWRIVSNNAGVDTGVLSLSGPTPIDGPRRAGWTGKGFWHLAETTDIYGGRHSGRYEAGNATFVWTQRVGTIGAQDETWAVAAGKLTLNRMRKTCTFVPITPAQAQENTNLPCVFTPCTLRK